MNRRQFWLLEVAWPKETPDWVFLGRAVQRVGRMLHPDDWRDDDPSRGLNLDEWRDHVISPDLRQMSRDDAAALTKKHARASVRRANSSFTWIASHCRTGKLESGVRPVPGGEITSLPASVWKTEAHRLADRLVFCQMRIDDPFAYGAGGFDPQDEKRMGYIFIRRAGLDGLTWPTAEAIREAFPEGVPLPEAILHDKTLSARIDKLVAGVDEYSTAFRFAAAHKEPKRRRGPGFDWPALQRHLRDLLESEGVPDPALDPSFTKAGLERRAATWCQKNWGKKPGHASLFGQVTKAIEEYKRSKK